MRIVICFSIIIMLMNSGCHSQNNGSKNNGIEVGVFDVSNDDKHILFSHTKDKKTSIYVCNIDGSNVKQLIASKDKISFLYPSYSNRGDKFVFLRHKKGELNSQVCVAYSDGTNVQVLAEGKITDAIFSLNDSVIYYLGANEYARYSPIGVKSFHGYEIYAINLVDKSVKKITNLNSYLLYNITNIDNKTILVRDYETFYIIPIDTPNNKKRFFPLINSMDSSSCAAFYSPRFNKMIVMTPLMLHVIDYKTKESNILTGGCYGYSSFFHKEERILFTQNDHFGLYSINLDGSGLEKINIELPQ